MTKQIKNYKESFVAALKRLLRAYTWFVLLVIIIAFLLVIVAMFFGKSDFFSNIGNNKVMTVFLAGMALLLWIFMGTFVLFYQLEVLINDTKCWSATKIAIKLILQLKGMWRMLGFILLFLLVGIISLALIFILSFLNIIFKTVVSDGVIAILSMTLLFPLNLIVLINFYHDFTLRFGKS